MITTKKIVIGYTQTEMRNNLIISLQKDKQEKTVIQQMRDNEAIRQLWKTNSNDRISSYQ